ncbi:hypothetical protein MPSEU_000761300 [Mayamaea pseudoterrestris]|nr:hypothetical protein MPSEU_000761300 [Mayamaea pseudoterrestris]
MMVSLPSLRYLVAAGVCFVCLIQIGFQSFRPSFSRLDISAVQSVQRRNLTVPLRPACLEIISKANLTDTTYVNVAGNLTEHPHVGAVDAFGKPGYVHDVTALRRNPPPSNFTDEYIAEQCQVQDDDYKMLKQRVSVDMDYENERLRSGERRPRILCMIYTYTPSHSRIKNIRETWGPKCDGFFAASDSADPFVDSVNLTHQGPESMNNMWQKVRSMWSYAYDNFYESYDWFHIGGDDLFLIVENLRRYLESDEIQAAQNGGLFISNGPERMQVPLYLGKRFRFGGRIRTIFNTGGPGYTLNRAALKLLVVDGLPHHYVHDVTSAEDIRIARVFEKLGVYPYETRDENGGERYHHYSPAFHYDFRLNKISWLSTVMIDPLEGLNHSSPHSVAFHYVKDDDMRRAYSLLYHDCPADNTVDKR